MIRGTGPSRDLRSDRRTVVDESLQGVDLGAEQVDFDTLAKQLQQQLQHSNQQQQLH